MAHGRGQYAVVKKIMVFGVTQIHIEPVLFFLSMIYFIQTLGLGSTEEKQKILKDTLLDQNSNIS